MIEVAKPTEDTDKGTFVCHISMVTRGRFVSPVIF